MKNLYLFLYLFYASIVFSQTINGKIISADTKEPISYAKIGIESENIGAITDREGNFTLKLDNISPQKTVMVEVAGFETYKTSVADFVKTNPQTIVLNEKVQQIAEVKISPKKLVEKNWGVNTKTKSVLFVVNPRRDPKQYIRETALEFSTKKNSKLQKINLNIASFDAKDPVFLRYSIYSEKDGMPDELIIDYEITAELTQDKIIDGTFKVDVSGENIWVKNKFFVGIQFMNDFEGAVYISAALLRAGFTRSFYNDWEKISIAAPAINIDVKVDKNYENAEEDDKKIKTKDEKLFLNDFNNLQKFKDEALKSKFGNNPKTGRHFKTQNLDMYYETYGSGEPLFLLHGNGGNIQTFYKQIDDLSKHFKVIAIDTRAQGNSKDFTTENFTYELFAHDLKNLADHLNLKKASIIGWSDGGIIGLIYAVKYPESINKLIAIGANTNPNGVSQKDIDDMKTGLKKEITETPENINSIRLLRLMIEEPNLTKNDLSKIKCPTLIVAGERDIILPEHTRNIAKSIPKAKLKIVKDATHSLIQEKPKEFNAFAIKFLKTGKL